MSEPPLPLFPLSLSLSLSLSRSSSPTSPPPRISLLFLSHSDSLSVCLPLSPPPLSPGVSPRSPHKARRQRIRASPDMTCRRRLWGAVGTHTLDSRRRGSSAPTNETPDCCVKHTVCVRACVHVCECVCVWACPQMHNKTMNVDAEIMKTKIRKSAHMKSMCVQYCVEVVAGWFTCDYQRLYPHFSDSFISLPSFRSIANVPDDGLPNKWAKF